MNDDAKQRSDAAALEAMSEAVLGGHDLGPWRKVKNGWEAACRRCGRTTWIGQGRQAGLRYSVLGDVCPGDRGRGAVGWLSSVSGGSGRPPD